MPKQMYTMNNFSGGINNAKDSRDISINEFAHLQGFMTDQNGALRPIITSVAHNGLVAQKSLGVANHAAVLVAGGGYNFGYFETDHDFGSDASITGVAIVFNDGGFTTYAQSSVPTTDLGSTEVE